MVNKIGWRNRSGLSGKAGVKNPWLSCALLVLCISACASSRQDLLMPEAQAQAHTAGDRGPAVNAPSPGGVAADASASRPNAEPRLERSDFVTGLSNPWDLAFADDGTMFFTEKCKGLSLRRPDGSRARLFGTSDSAMVAADLVCEGQSGVGGVALDPEFAQNRNVYVYMVSKLSSPPANRVVRLTLNAALSNVISRTDIITGIPFKHRSNSHGGPGAHSGGRIRFGPDGYLYVPTGDNHNGTIPQDLTSLGGKVLRVDRNGNAAPGNNTPSGGDPRIYTYGHRNIQGISFHPRTGRPYIAEHGPNHSDEVTALVAGGNGGWDPKPSSGVECEDNYCGYGSNRRDGRPTPMTDLEKFPNAMRPVWSNDGESDGLAPAQFLSGARWQGWSGDLAVGLLSGSRVMVLELDENGALRRTKQMELPSTRMRALVQGPDGNLYVATDGGAIWKVVPQARGSVAAVNQ